MANEADAVEKGTTGGEATDFTIADATAISKGSVLILHDPRAASGSAVGTSGAAFAGIAAADKTASDGATNLALWTKGIFDLVVTGGTVGITAGQPVRMSGANTIERADASDLVTGGVIGKALETGSAGERIEVLIG